MAASGAPGGITATTYNDDSILQALRRLQPDDLIKHMLETEDWSERLTKQCGEELSRAAGLNLFVPPQDGTQVKLELEAASSVAGLAGLQVAAERPAVEPANLIQQTMQALALAQAQEQESAQSEAAAAPQTGVSAGNPPSYPY